MKILGIGVDIVENKRIQKSIKNPLFKKRIYSSKELKQSNAANNKVAYFSKRFAAKEAFSKALGTGFRMNLNFKDIEVVNDKMGKPYYVKNKTLARQYAEANAEQFGSVDEAKKAWALDVFEKYKMEIPKEITRVNAQLQDKS